MDRSPWVPSALTLLVSLAACSGGSGDDRDAGLDAGSRADAMAPDGGVDAGPDAIDLQLLGIADFHGRVMEEPGVPGVSRLAAQIEQLRAEQPSTLVLSAGDLVGASTLHSGLLHDEPTIDAMDLLGLDVSTVGNHEFDRPLEELMRLVEGGCHPEAGCADSSSPFDGASFPMLGANVIDAEGGEPPFPSYVVLEAGEVHVGVIGVTLEDTASIVYAPYVEGLRFEDEADRVNALVPEVLSEGADVIVVLMHESITTLGTGCLVPGGPGWDVVGRLDPEVDVVIAGHRHTQYVCRGTPLVVGAGRYGEAVADIDLVVDRASREVLEATARLVPVETEDTNEELDVYLDWLDDIVAPLAREEVGRITADVSNALDGAGSQGAGYLVADAMLEASADAAFALTNHGGQRITLSLTPADGESEPGIVTYGELYALVPFGNTVLTVTLTGAQVETLLEQQYQADAYRPLQPSTGIAWAWSGDPTVPGDHVDPADILVDGAPIDLDAEYRVAVNSFIAEGGGGFEVLVEGTGRTGGPGVLEAVVSYLETSSPYAPPALDRIERR